MDWDYNDGDGWDAWSEQNDNNGDRFVWRIAVNRDGLFCVDDSDEELTQCEEPFSSLAAAKAFCQAAEDAIINNDGSDSPVRPPRNADANRANRAVVEALAAIAKCREEMKQNPEAMGRNDGGFAFPVPVSPTHEGMTLRDYFAGQVLMGLASSSLMEPRDPATLRSQLAYKYADAMLEARE